LSVEYPEELLRELRMDAARIETTGVLYGERGGAVVTLQRLPAESPPIGIYVLRARGEVFLSEANIDLFERQRALIALVIAGRKGGFFLHGYDGSLESVCSYEEFEVPRPPRGPWRAVHAAGLVCLAALPIAALAYVQQTQTHRTQLAVQEQGERLLISWKPGRTGVLQISDGTLQTSIPVSPNQSSWTYLRRSSSEVKVVLTWTKPGP
jgi:hypothetical protein